MAAAAEAAAIKARSRVNDLAIEKLTTEQMATEIKKLTTDQKGTEIEKLTLEPMATEIEKSTTEQMATEIESQAVSDRMVQEAENYRAAKRIKSDDEHLSQAEIDRMAEEQKDRAEDEFNRTTNIADDEARKRLQEYCLFMKNAGPHQQDKINKAILMTLDWLDTHPFADKEQIWDQHDELESVITDDWQPCLSQTVSDRMADDTDDLMQVEIERVAKNSLDEFNRTKIEAKNSLDSEHYESDEEKGRAEQEAVITDERAASL